MNRTKALKNHLLTNFLLSFLDFFLVVNYVVAAIIFNIELNVQTITVETMIATDIFMYITAGLSFIYFVLKGFTGPSLTYSRFSTSITIDGQIYTIREDAYNHLEIKKGADGRGILIFFINVLIGIFLMVFNFIRAIVETFIVLLNKKQQLIYSGIDIKKYWEHFFAQDELNIFRGLLKYWFFSIPIITGFIFDIILLSCWL